MIVFLKGDVCTLRYKKTQGHHRPEGEIAALTRPSTKGQGRGACLKSGPRRLMWAILGAPTVPVSVHLFARVHVATLRTTRLGEFDFRFRSVQARGPQHAAVRCFIRSRACDGTGDAGRARSAAGRAVQRHQALACLPSPGPRRARAQVAGSRTLPSSTGSRQRPAQAKDSPEIAGAPAFHLPKRIGRSVSTFVRGV